MSKREFTMIDNMLEVSAEEREVYAEAFSEGNKELRELLLFLWDNNINTIGCCAGHNDEEESDAYISFEIQGLTDVQLKNLIYVLYINSPTGTTTTLDNMYHGEIKKTIGIHFSRVIKTYFGNIQKLVEAVLKIPNVVKTFDGDFGKDKVDAAEWVMGLNLKEYSDKLIVPSYCSIQLNNNRVNGTGLLYSFCRELEGIKSQEELINKIKNSDDFENYYFQYKENGCVKLDRADSLKNKNIDEVISARNCVRGFVNQLSGEEVRQQLKFIQEETFDRLEKE